MRDIAKRVNSAMAFGVGDAGLMAQTKMTLAEVQVFRKVGGCELVTPLLTLHGLFCLATYMLVIFQQCADFH